MLAAVHARRVCSPPTPLEKRSDGRYLLRLKTRWRDGTTRLLLEPIELMERLAAQVPKPRINLVLYSGVLTPDAKRRANVVGYAGRGPCPTRPPPGRKPKPSARRGRSRRG